MTGLNFSFAPAQQGSSDRKCCPIHCRQSGQTILIMVLILAMGSAFIFFDLVRPGAGEAERIHRTDAALALAKDALKGRAVSDDNRPGSLPCPDIDGDGDAEGTIAAAGIHCPRYVGRFPWRTLDLPELRDGYGEPLWYALDPDFRDNPTAQPINTDSLGTRIVFAENNLTVLTNLGAAIVFAPGPTLTGQARATTQFAPCAAAAGANIAQHLCANNYLESISGINNASAAGPYIAAGRSATFNDRLVALDSIELMAPVEARAAREIRALLIAYQQRSPCGCYPFANTNGSGIAVWNTNQGFVPLVSAAASLGANSTVDWLATAPPPVVVPPWLTDNDWHRVMFYMVSDRYDFQLAGPTLEVDGSNGKHVVLVTAGAATGARPNFPNDYIDDTDNRNADNDFQTPVSQTRNRDRLYVIP
jgi:hypothetical protein